MGESFLGQPGSSGQRVRLAEYPARFRVRIAGQVVQVRVSAHGEPLRYEAVVRVKKSRPLPPSTAHQLTGIPMVEVVGDDLDDSREVTAGTDDEDVDSDSSTEQTAVFPQYRLVSHSPKILAPLYPDRPPLGEGALVRLVWHGQRIVPGIEAGTYVRCSGMLSTEAIPATIFNPRYEIVPYRTLVH